MPKSNAFTWSTAMHRFCEERTHLLRRDLTEQFNQKFNTQRCYDTIRNFCKRNGYHTGRTGQFKKGSIPPNKGRKGWSAPGTEATRFKAGHRPKNAVPIGARRKTTKKIGKDGRVLDSGLWKVKVSEPNTWQFEHRRLWVSMHGPVPKGHAIIFIDGDQDNVVIENLQQVTRGELAILNKQFSQLKDASAEERAVLITMAKLKASACCKTFTKADRQLAIRNGLNPATAYARIIKGWPKRKALTAPVGSRQCSTTKEVTA